MGLERHDQHGHHPRTRTNKKPDLSIGLSEGFGEPSKFGEHTQTRTVDPLIKSSRNDVYLASENGLPIRITTRISFPHSQR